MKETNCQKSIKKETTDSDFKLKPYFHHMEAVVSYCTNQVEQFT